MLDGTTSPKEFTKQNKISFVTFNYDRFLETWLFERIRYSFGLEEDAAVATLQKIPIHHVYGMFGPVPKCS